MKKNILAKKIEHKFYYGWIIVCLAALSVFFSAPGQTYSFSAFKASYLEAFSLNNTQLSGIYSVATVLSGSLLVFVGKATDKYGQRFMMTLVGTMLAMACLFNSFIQNTTMLFIGFFIMRYFGQGSMTLIPGSLVPQWFEKRRAFAISLYTFGGILANTLVPAFNIKMIETFSWQGAWRVWSLLILFLFVPVVAYLVINKPEDMNLLPDNRQKKDDHDVEEELEKIERESWHLNEALKTKEFWFIGIISMVAPMISTGLMFHFYTIMPLKGLSQDQASYIIGLVAIPGFIMPVIAGLVIDKMREKYLLLITLTIIAVDMIFMLWVKNIYMASAFMLIYGLAINIQGITISVIWAKYFGRKHLGSIRGAATVFMVIGSALGPVPFGISLDKTGDSNAVFIVMAIFTFLSLALALSIHQPHKRTHDRKD